MNTAARLSSHLVDAHDRKPNIQPQSYAGPSRPTVPQTPYGQMLDPETSWMSGHGGYTPSFAHTSASTASGFSRWSEEKIAALQVRLARRLGPEYITQRPGPGGGPKLSYVEGWKVINLANEVFGFNGWSSSIQSLTTDFCEVNEQGRCSVNITAIIRITLADGSWHEDVGCGQGENIKGRGSALDKAKKEAVTDGTKRALRTFGNVLGNCLYDKEYAKEIVKIKVPPAKFLPADLERRPEFAPPPQAGPSRPPAIPSHVSNLPRPPVPAANNGASENERPVTPLRSVQDLPADMDDVFMDEGLDGEFLAMAEQSLVEADRKSASPSKSAVPTAPTYQHRHRPDLPQQQSSIEAAVEPSKGAAARMAFLRAQQGKDATSTPASEAVESTSPVKISSSSASSATVTDGGARKPVGGFNYPQGHPKENENRQPAPTVIGGRSARAMAILNLSNEPKPIRSESPRIPSGGIDAAAQKATANFAERASALGLDSAGLSENAGSVSFTSARGMKRSISTDERGSPTKATYKTGPRTVLGELNESSDYAADDGAKRQRY